MPALIFLLAFIAIPVFVIIAIKKTRIKKRLYKVLAAIAFVLIGWAILFLTFSKLYPSKAESETNKTFQKLDSLNARLICDNSDSGYGPANDTPWYVGYYSVQVDPEETIKDLAFRGGYRLETDTKLIEVLADPENHTIPPDNIGLGDREAYHSSNSYLKAADNGYELDVTIYRSGQLNLYCAVPKWGITEQIPTSGAIVEIHFSAPDTN